MSKKSKQMEIDDFLKDENVNPVTGEITAEKFGEVIEVRTLRKDGTVRIQQDFSNCPSMAEQHTAHLTNINYLMEKFKPDEVAAYIAARSSLREPLPSNIISETPGSLVSMPDYTLQESMNVVYNAKTLYKELDPEVQRHFATPLEFIKFIDNPANAEKMVRLGLIQKKQVEDLKKPLTTNETASPAVEQATTTTQEEAKRAKAKKTLSSEE